MGDGSDWKKRFYRVWPENEEVGTRKCRTLSHVVLEQLMGSEFAIVLSCLALSPQTTQRVPGPPLTVRDYVRARLRFKLVRQSQQTETDT